VQGRRQARRPLVDIDLVIEVQAIGQGHLVQEQVLGGEVALLGQAVPGVRIAMEIAIQALEDIRDGIKVVPLDNFMIYKDIIRLDRPD